MSTDLKTTITHRGQRFVDEPVFVQPKTSVIGVSVAHAFGHKVPQPIVTHHERVRLLWKKPSERPT